MSRRLTDEEIAERYSQQYRVPTPEAGLSDLGGSAIDRLQAKAFGMAEPFGLSRDYRLAQEAEAGRTTQRYYDTNQDAVGSYKNISGFGDVGRYAAELGVQTLPELVPIVGAGLIGGPAAAYGVAGLSGIGEVMQAQREQAGRTDLTAIPLGLAYGGVEAATGIVGKLAGTGVRAERVASAANRYLDNLGGFAGGAARTGAAFGRTGFSEALGEVGQEYISNVGRLAIDPRVELFSPEAMDDYAESFVGGGLLGGLLGGAAGGWRRSQGFRDAARERDLTSTETQQETGLQRPLDSQFVTQDQTVGLQSFINQNVGITRPKRKDYVAQFKAAYDEPTGQFVNDPETGIERPLTVGEALQRSQAPLDMTQEKPADAAATAQVVANTVRDPRSYELRDTFNVTPTPSSLQFYSEITADAQAAGVPLDSDLFIDVWKFASDKPMTPKRLEKARELLDSAIIKARQEAPSGTGISTVQQPAGGVGVGSPVVQGSVGDAGRPAPVAGTMDGGAPATGATLQQAGVLPIAAGQPSTPVTTTAPAAAPAPETRFRRAPRPMTVLEAANAAKAAQAQQTETQGQTAPAAAGPVVDERQAILQQIFGERDGNIIFDVVGMGMPEPEAAAKYGTSRSNIQKIAGATGQKTWPERIAKAKAQFGLTDAQIADAFNTVAPDSTEGQIASQVFAQSQDRMDENEAIEANLGNIFETAGGSTGAVEGFTKLQKEIDATLEALAVETNPAVLADLNAKLAAQIEKVKAVEKQAQAEVRALAGRKSDKDASDEKEAKAEQPAELGAEDAVQVESPAGVSVQPEAKAGKGVGGQVRRAKKPAAEGKAQVPAKVLTEAEQAAQAWDVVAADYPQAPKFADLTKAQQQNFIEFGPDNWERGDVELELTKLARAAAPAQRAIGSEPVTIDVEARVVEETVAPQIAKLPAPQVTRLENHYGVKQGTPEFLAKVKADVVLYATKGAEAVAGAIRDIIKSIHAGVLSVAMIFNPTAVSQIEAFVVIPQETQTTTQQVLAELPAEVKGMSEAGKQAYATLIPALKGKIGDKFVTIADKPSGRIFVFKANGDLVLQKKALFGLAKGDLYKGNNDLKQNRVTPAGLFGINVVDAAKGGAAATTAGDYDFGKVFALDDPDATVTFMHSVWLKESDAAKRAAALKNDSAADSRYSFGCINVDKETFKDMVGKYSDQMDGSKLFVVPDVQSTVNDFITGNVANDRLVREGIQPVTKTTTTPVKSATKTAGVDRTVAAKEEEVGGMKFGKDAAVAENPYTASELLADIKDFIRADIPGRKLVIVDSINDLLNSGTLSQREVGAALQAEGAYGVAKDGVAYLVADRIQKGEGRAKFMHEVGSHLGLENLLPKATYNQLVNQIEQWAGADNGSLESQLAAKAKSRVGYAKTPTADQRDELLAYFVEEAMLAGVDPTASTKESGPLTNWFRTLWTAFKIAIRKLGFKPETLMARDVVNMAFGAARLEMNGSWHGTAAQFRRFNHAFMSSGEGAQAYGWGTYLAQSVGIAKAYWSADTARKEKLNVQNTLRQYVGWRVAETILHPVDRHTIVSANSKITETANLVEYFKLDWSKFTTPYALANDLLDVGVDQIKLVSPKGKTITVKLEAPAGSLMRLDTAVTDDEMLDWDASFAEQPEVVRNFVKQEAANIKALREAGANIQITSGADVLRYLIARFYKDTGLKGPWADAEPELKTRVKEQASKYMQARGIKGIRFFDADSRDSTLDNISFTKNGKTVSGRDGVLNAYFTPGAIVQGYGGPDKVVKYDPVKEVVTVIAVDNNGNPRRGERERTHFTMPSVKEVGLAMQQRGYDLGASNRTRNLVIFNENDIFRAGSQVGADRQRMKFGIEGPTLQEREGGRVLELVVNGKATQSFELVKKSLWDAYKGEGQQQLLRNKGAQEVSDRAKDALSMAQFNFRQSGPLNRVEEQVLEDLERGDIEGLRGRITMLASGGQVRSEIGSLISHAVYNTDEALNSSDKAAKYAPKWMLGQAERPAQPEQQLSRRTGPAPRMKFGKNAVSQGLIDRNIAKLPKMSQQPVKRVVESIGDLGGAGLDYVVFTSDLVKRAQALGLGAAKTFSDRLAARNAKVSEEERKIEKIADRYASIEDDAKGSGPGSVNEFLFESTRTGKWGYGKYRDAKMGAAFDKLGPKAQQFVKDVFAHGDATLSNKKKIVLEATNSEYDAMIKAAQDAVNSATDTKARKNALDDLANVKAEKATTLKRFQTLFRIREGMPYAPIKRTGKYVVIGKSAEYIAAETKGDTATVKKLESDPDHYHVSFVDTKLQARNLKDNLAEQGVFPDPQFAKRAESFDEMFSGEAALPAVTKLRNAVDARATTPSGAKDPTAGKLLNIISQLYLEALAEGSARKSEMRRRGVAGEVDMLQSFTQQGRADANFLASVEYEPKIQDALQQMRSQSRTGDRDRKSEIFDELTKRYAGTLNPQPSPFINGLTNMASKFFLASSPGYYLQNLTQPFMMSLPAMAGRHDYTKAAAELAKAYTELGPLFKDVKLFDEQFDFSKVPADVRAAINDLVNQGKIDIGLATEINEYKVEADNKLSKFAQRLNKGMRMAVQKVEATNRLSTAIAAYRLEFERAKKDPKIADPKAAATQYAADILTDTHGDYTAFNAPRAFNTQWGKVALQFRKFQLIQIAFYAKLFRDLGRTPEERAVAMKTLAYSLSHTAVFAGMMGIPGYAAASFILGLFGDEDEPYDLTADMRKAIGPEWADMIMRGAPTIVGMDLSGKIGAGNMLSIMPFSNADLSTTSGQVEAFGAAVGGAALGMATRVADGLLLIAKGDYYKGIERTMPKGVSDALKAGRQAAEGMTRRNGDVILPDSEISALDTVFTALGVPVVEQAVTYERQNRLRDITTNFNDRTTRIKNDYAKAVREKDTEGMAESRAAWTKLQQTRQSNGLKPQPMSNLLKAPQEQAQREKRTVGGVQYREGQRKLAESIAEN